jgi:hypothetical protein
MKSNKILCKGCERYFVLRHGNRKFHSDRCCDQYHNLKAKERRNEIKNISKPLLANYTRLKEILGNNSEVTISIDFLKGAKVNLQCYTTLNKDGNGNFIYSFFNKISVIEFIDKIIIKRYEIPSN